MLFLTIFLILFIGAYCNNLELNNSPIIGIFAQPSTSTEGDCKGNCQYIAASYVKVHKLNYLFYF